MSTSDPSTPQTGGFRPWPVLIIGVAVVIVVFGAIFLIKNPPREESLHQRVNDAAASINVGVDPIAEERPSFGFHLNETPPRFSVILCVGASDDSRLDPDSWHLFLNEVRKYGPAESYLPEFQDAGEKDGTKLTRLMLYTTLQSDATEQVAEELAGKIMKVMREDSPCK